MTHFTKSYWITFLAIVAIIAWLEFGLILINELDQLVKIVSVHSAIILGKVAGFFLFNLLVFLAIYWLFYRPVCKLMNFGFLCCCLVGIMVCVANYFIGEYVFGPSIIEKWWLMVIPGVLYGIVFGAIYFNFNHGFKNR